MVFKSWSFLASYVFEIDAENGAYRVSMKRTWLSTVCVYSYYRILTRSKLIFILGGNSGWGNGTGNRQYVFGEKYLLGRKNFCFSRS